MAQTISVEEALNFKDALFLDTRTPSEFEEDHLPNAVNLPILSDEERALVGTIYKQQSKEEALGRGKDLFRQKILSFIKEIETYKNKTIIVNCWRGGMRSKAVVDLLAARGYRAYQLEGGYKAYRAHIRQQLESFHLKPKLIVLWGLTCTGKTQLLSHFSHSLDLEGLAQHRGSLYGGIGLKPRTQKAFENLLYWRLQELNQEKFMVVEGESRKIGEVQMPAFLYKAMVQGIPVLVTRSVENRAEQALKEYFKTKQDVEMVKEVTKCLFKVISKANKEKVIQLLDQDKNQDAVKILLEHYYDPLYLHTVGKKEYALEINNDNEKEAVRELKNFIMQLPR